MKCDKYTLLEPEKNYLLGIYFTNFADHLSYPFFKSMYHNLSSHKIHTNLKIRSFEFILIVINKKQVPTSKFQLKALFSSHTK